MIVYCNPKSPKPKKRRAPKGEVAKKYKPTNTGTLVRGPSTPVWAPTHGGYKSLEMRVISVSKPAARYEDEEMAERERIALEHSERMKKCLAPAFNKGPMQPMMTREQALWAGRK